MSISVPPLPYKHLITLRLDVDSAGAARIGATPEGHRTIASVTGKSKEHVNFSHASL